MIDNQKIYEKLMLLENKVVSLEDSLQEKNNIIEKIEGLLKEKGLDLLKEILYNGTEKALFDKIDFSYVDINSEISGNRPIFIAIKRNQFSWFKYIIDHEDFNFKKTAIYNDRNLGVLEFAILYNRIDMIKYILENYIDKININSTKIYKNFNYVEFVYRCMRSVSDIKEITNLLIEKGWHIEENTKNGQQVFLYGLTFDYNLNIYQSVIRDGNFTMLEYYLNTLPLKTGHKTENKEDELSLLKIFSKKFKNYYKEDHKEKLDLFKNLIMSKSIKPKKKKSRIKFLSN